MGLLSRLLGNKQNTEDQPGNTSRNASYEEQLQKDFGLQYGNEGWLFEGGRVIDDLVTNLIKPELCIAILKGFQGRVPFTKVCIVADRKPIVFVCNTRPKPLCIISGLNNAELVAELVAMMMKSENTTANEYRGTWVLTLSSLT